MCGGQREQFDTEFLLGTNFMAPSLKKKILSECDWSSGKPSAACEALVAEMYAQVGPLNLYDVYGNCISGDGNDIGRGKRRASVDATMMGLGGSQLGLSACIDSVEASDYFNRADVQAAIHVRKPSERWATCATEPGWTYNNSRANLPRDTYPALVKYLSKSGRGTVIYNGDWDACVPWPDAVAWTTSLGLPVGHVSGSLCLVLIPHQPPHHLAPPMQRWRRTGMPGTIPWTLRARTRRRLAAVS